jgi:hypothetical protein
MTEEASQNSEISEVAPIGESQVNEQQQADAIKAKRQEADERNWKAMRLKNAELEKELKKRQEVMDQILQAQLANSAPKPEPDEFDSIGAGEFIPKATVERLVEKKAQQYAEQIAKKEIEKHFKQQNDSQFLERLGRQYSDFSEIVNPETLSLLEESEPELAKTIADLKDPYKMGVQTYKYIKAMNLSQKVPDVRRQKETEKQIEKAEKSIPSPASFDKRPIAQAFKMTDAMKKDLYREMMGYAASASAVPEMA